MDLGSMDVFLLFDRLLPEILANSYIDGSSQLFLTRYNTGRTTVYAATYSWEFSSPFFHTLKHMTEKCFHTEVYTTMLCFFSLFGHNTEKSSV